MAFFIGMVVIVGLMGLGVFAGGGYADMIGFVSVPGLIIVLVPSIAFLLIVAPWERVKLSLKLVFSSNAEADEGEVTSACALLNSFGVVGLMFAIIAMITGLILMASDLSRPERIGINMAVALNTVYYGVLLRLLCYLATKRIKNRLLTEK